MAKSHQSGGAPTSGTSRAQRPQAKTAVRREEILQAALSVFGARGYHNGSLVEIAEQAGMTHAGVLHHFGSKEQLLIAVLEYRDEADVVNLEDHRAPKGADFLRHLVLTARENMARPGIVQAYTVLAGESVTDEHPAHEFFQGRYRGLRKMLVDALTLVAGDVASAERIDTAAAVIVAVMDGLQIQWLLEPDSIDMQNAVELAIEGVLAQLSVSATGGILD